jgi:hypothetical protein
VAVKLIGYWIQSLRDEEYCAPQELAGEMPADLRELVAKYLDSGIEFQGYRGLSWCRFYCGRKMGSKELSDGYWVWPEDLGHYVRDHGVILSQEFVAHVQSGKPPLAMSDWDHSKVDKDFWKTWCREHRSESLAKRIAEAKLRADVAAQAAFAKQVRKREKKEGLSSATCQWRGCTNKALQRRALCAACCMKDEWTMWTMDYYDLRPVLKGR